MEQQFWIDSWNEGGFKTSFHRKDIHPYILEHLNKDKIEGKRILVPLCGKSVDLLYFKSHAEHIIGVELVTKAVYEFFEEQRLPFKQVGSRFESGALTILNSDFLSLTTDDIGKIDIIYDRASLVALPQSLRSRYIEKVHELLPRGASQFINTVEYSPFKPEPPFSISASDIASYYGNTHQIEHVESQRRPNHGLIRRWGLDYVNEHGFWLTKVK